MQSEWFLMFLSIALVLMVEYLHKREWHVRVFLAARPGCIRWMIYMLLFWSVVMFGIYGVNYEASAFIYFQF